MAVAKAGEDPYSVRDRLQAKEQSISSEISGLNVVLQAARAASDEKSAYRLLRALKSAREEHRKQADSLLKAEGRITLLEVRRGDLVTLSVAKDFLSKIIIHWLSICVKCRITRVMKRRELC
jgi:hypothetical protein